MNCSALSPHLAESELFGHERGAFTGALGQRKGRFELADGGTLFLDEVADLPAEIQPKLLRALQEGQFERVGGEKTISCTVRIISASNKSLETMVKTGEFREDLFYRLGVYPLTLPPLRERKGDPSLLAHYFLEKIAAREGKSSLKLSSEAYDYIERQKWPGNVRELQNSMERAAILAQWGTIEPKHLGKQMRGPGFVEHLETQGEKRLNNGPIDTLDRATALHIKKALDFCGGKIYGSGGAAEVLGLKPSTLQSKIKKLGIV